MGLIALAALLLPAAVNAQSATDYDSDNDGLIEVANLAQLNAVRWDLDGNGAATVTASYWDTTLSGQSTSGGGTGKTTSELQTPTSNTGIYSTWGTTNWDFGTAVAYPLLKADWDGDGTATVAEFGDQTIDYDTDDDGLIEMGSLAQLNAVRWDLDGNGSSSAAGYAAAFPDAPSGMGCNQDEATYPVHYYERGNFGCSSIGNHSLNIAIT